MHSDPSPRPSRIERPGRAASSGLLAAALLLGACTTVPRTIDADAVDARAEADLRTLFEGTEAPTGTLGLAEAVARALKYNLDTRLAMMESVIAERHLDLADYDKLPQLAARAGYSRRDNVLASSSFNLNTGVPNFGASTSQDRGIFNADLELSWNILDVGIAYVDARQRGDEALIAIERHRRTTANVLRDVRDAYWRLVAAERLARPLGELKGDIRRGLADSYAAQRAKLKPLEECLEDQRLLLDLQRQVLVLQRGIGEARSELGALMGMAPGTPFEIDMTTELLMPWSDGSQPDLAELQRLALRHRPELIEEDYRSRIAADEVLKARWRWVPGFELFAGGYHNDNSFLLNNEWAAVGARLSWNMLRVFSTPAAVRLARSEQELGEIRRLALGMAVLTQVDVSVQRLSQAREDYSIATEMGRVDRATYEQYRRSAGASRLDGPTLLRARARDVVSRLRHGVAFAEMQSAVAGLYASIGRAPGAVLDPDRPLEELEAEVQALLDSPRIAPPRSFYDADEAASRRARAEGYRAVAGEPGSLSRPGQ